MSAGAHAPTATVGATHADPTAARAYLDAMFGTAERGCLAVWNGRTRLTEWVPVAVLDRAADRIARLAGDGDNVFVGMGLQRAPLGPTKRGTAATVCGIPGIWMDLDIAGPAHKQAALPPDRAAVLDLLGGLPLRSSLLVDSGNGLYAFWLFPEFWAFDDDEERAQAASMLRRWQAMVRGAARRRGWVFEGTADLARVLRPAGAVNFKLGAAPVRVIHEDAARYLADEIEAFLPDEDGAAPGRATTRGGGGRAGWSAIAERCAYLRHCRDDAATLPEPEWHAMMSVVAQCRDGERLAHELSRAYPGYNRAETQGKYEHAHRADKPLRCATIRDDRSGEAYCAACPHWGAIWSPIELGHPLLVRAPRPLHAAPARSPRPRFVTRTVRVA